MITTQSYNTKQKKTTHICSADYNDGLYRSAMNSVGANIKTARENLGWNQSELARRLDVSPQAVQKWEKGGTPRNKRLEDVAEVLGVSVESLLTGHGLQPEQSLQDRRPGLANSVSVPLMNAAASMGLGLAQPDHETVVDVLRLSKEWVHSNLKSATSPANLAALSAYGDSMAPTFADGDILIVDRGVTDIRLDAVYVLALHGELYIKRIQRRITDGAVIIKSDNPVYEAMVIANGDRDNLQVLGRVLWAWNGRKL